MKISDVQKLVNLRSDHIADKVNKGKSVVWKFSVW